jgi:hypothetical protein
MPGEPGSTCSARPFRPAPSMSASPNSTRSRSRPACGSDGLKPFCAIYSTFLQRGYDQVVHDVAIQNLPVRFAIDRAGLVGADGPTHAGSSTSPISAPAGHDLHGGRRRGRAGSYGAHLAAYRRPADRAFRYPRGEGVGVDMPEVGTILEIGKGRVVREGTAVAILSLWLAPEGCAEGRLTRWSTRACRPRLPMPASPSRWTRTWLTGLRKTMKS